MKKTIIKSSKEVSDEQKRKRDRETCPECGSTISGFVDEKIIKNKILKIIPIYGSVETYVCYKCGCKWRVE